ncbi:hypothetical protein F5141DRAFT_118312 [Pisolithus sp. B1]|nr:hypothetical protein F5141DRAFT_118312 [Pisolithus sp. B1]
MGPTGAGKSTFIDRTVGRPDMGAGHDLTSCTREVRAVRYPHVDGVRNFVLVDTPGFDDTFMTDVQILQRIAHWLYSTYKRNVKLSGLLYLHRISGNRMGKTPLRNYNMFKELCGRDNFKNIILVTTMWDEVTEEVGSAREQELHADFWRAMIALGSTTHRFERTTESAWKIINSLSVAPLIQQIPREMVDEHLPLHRTTAGRANMATPTGLMSGTKGIFKLFANGRKRLPNPIPQGSRHRLQRSRPLLSITALRNLSFGNETEMIRPRVREIISLGGSGACSIEGCQGSLVWVIPVLQAALCMAELVRIPYLEDVISASLSVAVSIETITGTHHALFQVLETATLLVNVVTEGTQEAGLPVDIRAAIKDFAKQMSDVQGIVQNVVQRQSEIRQVLQLTDVRVISACAKSMRSVYDVLQQLLQLTPSLRTSLRAVDDSLTALKRSLAIATCSCWSAENDYVIFVVGPTGADQSWFSEKLFENDDIPVVRSRQHVQVLGCNHIYGPANIVVVSIPSLYTDHEDSGGEDTVVDLLKLWSFSETCHSGILFLYSLDSDSTHGKTLITRHLETFSKAFPNKFPVPSPAYVVPTINSDSSLPSETLGHRLSYLKTMLDGDGDNWHASMFPGVFSGQPEIAWSAALLLLKDIGETRARGSIPIPTEPALKRIPLPLPSGRLALKDLAELLFTRFRKREKNRDLGAVITLGRTVLELTPLQHPQHCSALINVADLLSERFEQKGSKEDLDEIITLRRTASESIAPDDSQKQMILLELDDNLFERLKREDSTVDLDEIISLRRAALEHTPPPNRCRALLNLANALHEQFQRKSLENSIDEAVSLAQAALGLYPPGHPDHTLSQDHLASYLEMKVGKEAPGAHVRGPGVNPSGSSSSDIKQSIKKAVSNKFEKIPLRLLHTPTGVLCGRDAQISHFEGSPQYKQLLSLAPSFDSQQLETEIDSVVSEYFEFITLSHKWGSGEPLLRDIEGKSIYYSGGTDGQAKLRKFCILALRRNFQWAWSDTCCIDKDSSAEVQEAIGSMFSWYRWSSLTIVHLSDVFDTGSLAGSVWFTRGWTLQELLASHTILFYTYDWSLYSNSDAADHKTDSTLLEELQNATGIAKQHLTNFSPGINDARSRLHWASGRCTTRPEDIAYSLFGIFQVHLPILYGESVQNALGRLLAEIISRSGDVSVLDWVGKPSSFNSCFPADPTPYQTVPHFQLVSGDPASPNDLDLEKAQKLYSNLARLPRAGFFNSKLVLPSTVYPVTAVKLQGSSTSPSRYTYEIHASGLTPLDVTLSVNLGEGAGRYILVRPWHPKALPTPTGDNDDAVWELLEQLKQPFNALLLKKLPQNEYRRIASDCMITALPRDLNSILDSQVLIPEIV